jgi:biopolymer transport protein ExbB/TolQ
VAPAIGLIGTIFGFIKTVTLVNSTEIVSRPELLDAAMNALVPAALGLMVAVPVTVMHASLRVRMDRVVVELEAAASRIVGFVSTLGEGEK